MLNDGDRDRLAKIEAALRADDPRFVDRFERARRSRRRTVAALIAAAASIIIVGVSLAYHSVAAAVAGLVAFGASGGVWLTARLAQRRQTEPRRP